MRLRMMILALAVFGAGCTTASLERRTVNQALSVSDLRYHEVMEDLAAMADNPGRLPAFALIDTGSAQVTETGQMESRTLWDQVLKGFSKETASVQAKHNPDQNWTVNPVASQPQWVALRCAFLWVLCGPPDPGSECMSLLRRAVPGEAPDYHFDVADQLARLPPGWLYRGTRQDVPRDACYVAHCHDTYVWVTADGLEGLSEFTLVLLDIATVAPLSLILAPPQATIESDIYYADIDGNWLPMSWGHVKENTPAQQTITMSHGEPVPGKITYGHASFDANVREIVGGSVRPTPRPANDLMPNSLNKVPIPSPPAKQ